MHKYNCDGRLVCSDCPIATSWCVALDTQAPCNPDSHLPVRHPAALGKWHCTHRGNVSHPGQQLTVQSRSACGTCACTVSVSSSSATTTTTVATPTVTSAATIANTAIATVTNIAIAAVLIASAITYPATVPSG